MGRGLAVVFAYAGHDVALIDLKQRDAGQFARLAEEARSEIAATLGTLARLGFFANADAAAIAARVRLVPEAEAGAVLPGAGFVFEGVPEVLEQKRAALALALPARRAGADHRLDHLDHPGRRSRRCDRAPRALSQRPLAQSALSHAAGRAVARQQHAAGCGRGDAPAPRRDRQGHGALRGAPGYIVPRIQALAMNEAARMVEEGVASAEEIDKAVKYGFGLRFAVLGLLEFIDWGGGDILYYASRYLTKALNNERYAAPDDRRAQHA